MIGFSVYNKLSGEILWSGNVPRQSDLAGQTQDDKYSIVEVFCNNAHNYVDATQSPIQIKSKVGNPAYLDGTTIKSVPDPSTVTLYDSGAHSIEVTDGEVTLDSDLPGTYRVVVNPVHARYYTAEFKVEL